ncbi:MAG TPA: DUF4097 family beta strand repeat-containing protein [Gemmatimonadaceae bacterium]|nr:DUF4097 family beta strand repeat-containing protein [Gemmatimonadaceae bacterium]
MTLSTMHRRSFAAIVIALVATLPATVGAQRPTRDRIDTTVVFSRSGLVDLRQLTGDVTVTGWSRDEVRVRAFAEHGAVRFEATGTRVTLEVEAVRGRIGDTGFEVTVPLGARVIANSTSGDVSVTGTRGPVEARSVTGDVTVSGTTGRTVLVTIVGDVEASNLTGEVRGESVNGDVSVTDVTGDVRLETTSGDIVLQRASTRTTYAETVNGEIEFDGTLDAAGSYEFRSHSGDIRLRLPDAPSARVAVETWSGEFETEFPVALQPGSAGGNRTPSRQFEFTLGAGSARMIIQSFSGTVLLERRSGPGR